MPYIISLDTYFNSGGGLEFGEISAEGNAVATTIAVANTWYQVTIFDTNGVSNGSVTPDHTNDHITLGREGMYLVTVSVSILSGSGATFVLEGELAANNRAKQFANVHFDRQLSGGGGDVGSVSMSGIIDAAAADTIELWVRNITNTVNVTVENVTMSVVQIGGT